MLSSGVTPLTFCEFVRVA